jgi:hypothetical protein
LPPNLTGAALPPLIYKGYITMTDTLYLLQLPYLNENGKPMCAKIESYTASSLRDNKTHEIIDNGDGFFVVTPIVPAATNVVFQIGQPAY